MANDDQILARGGLRPSMQPYGTVKRGYYRLTTSATIGVYVGTPVTLDSSGQAAVAVGGTGGTYRLLGSVLGFARDSRGQMGLPDNMSLITQAAYLPANTDAYVCVSDDPNQEYIIQEMDSGVTLTTASIGKVTGFQYRTATGSTLTGSVLCEIGSTFTLTAPTGGALRIVALADNMNSDGTYNSLGVYAKWRVRIADHSLNTPAVIHA